MRLTSKTENIYRKTIKKIRFSIITQENIKEKGKIKDNGKPFLYLYEAGQSVHLWSQISTQDGDSGQKKGRYIARKYLNGN